MKGRPWQAFPQERSFDDYPYHPICKTCGTAFDGKCATCKIRLYNRPKLKDPPLLFCGECGNIARKYRCSGCKEEYYCNRKCQLKHWPVHKKDCKKNSF